MSEPTIRYASVCSGVEAASLAWEKLDWKPVWFSEVEPFPCKVLAERFGASSPVNPLEPQTGSRRSGAKRCRTLMKPKWRTSEEMDEDAEAEYMVILEDQAKEILRLKQENEQLRHTVAAYQQKENAK